MALAVNEVWAWRWSGRLSRGGFAAASAVSFALLAAGRALPLAFGFSGPTSEPLGVAAHLLAGVLSLAGALNLLSAAVRRLHDFSYSAAAVLVFIVPGVNILVFLMLLALPGKAASNRFGPDPLVLKSISIEEWRRMSRGGDADAR